MTNKYIKGHLIDYTCVRCKHYKTSAEEVPCSYCCNNYQSQYEEALQAEPVKHGEWESKVDDLSIPIIEDIPKLCSICRDLGYLGAVVDEYFGDLTGSNIADEITEYITQLFNIKSLGEE